MRQKTHQIAGLQLNALSFQCTASFPARSTAKSILSRECRAGSVDTLELTFNLKNAAMAIPTV